jgi:hypothetical protein
MATWTLERSPGTEQYELVVHVVDKDPSDAVPVTLATVTAGVDELEVTNVTIRTVTHDGDLTAIQVVAGTAGAVELISVATGAAANLNAADKQVAFWGTCSLGAGKTIVANYTGTHTGPVSHDFVIRYKINTPSIPLYLTP